MSVWVKELLKSLDKNVDESVKMSIMSDCGAKCPFTHFNDDKLLELKKESKSEEEFLTNLCRQWRLENKNGQYFVVFDQCYCPLVNEDTNGASKTLCYCTLGNIKHKFRLGLGKEVEIEMQKTVLAGDDECRFLIKI
jgi:predicted hydrocarbon binding protein